MKTIIDLNGQWDFVADLDPKYHAVHGGFHQPEANRRHWLKVPVPGVWQKYGTRYDIFEGVCWFAREFRVPDLPAGVSARLRFGAVNYLADVYVNAQHVGRHEGGYTEFVFDVTDSLKPGTNHIAVMVDNRATTIKWPPCLGYFNYGGIHRSVCLEIADGPWLDNLRVDAVPTADGGQLNLRVAVRQAEPGLKVRVRSGGVSWEEAVSADGTVTCAVPFPGAVPWTPDNPVLYPLSVTLLRGLGEPLDEWVGYCGFRTIAIRHGRIVLNDQSLHLKGICYVYDSPTAGLTMTAEQIETDLKLMKEARCNAIRCHYPMDEKFYAACDRLGFLVWIEPPVYCYHPGDEATGTRFADPEWLSLAQQMAREMISVARNHPSVAIYSVGNECNTHNAEAEPFFRALAATIRGEDSSRLLSYAALYGIVGPVADIVDVLGINSYWGWYDRIWRAPTRDAGVDEGAGCGPRNPVERETVPLEPMRAMIEKVLADKPNLALLLTEFGADSVPGYYARSCDLWSEDYHHDLLCAILALAAEYPRIVGTFPFGFSDYRDPSKVPNGYWNELNLKGIVDYHRNRKRAFSAVRKSYA